MSGVSYVKIDGFEKIKIMVVRFYPGMKNDDKRHQFSLVFYDFEKLTSYFLLMNWNYLLFGGNVGLSDLCRIFWGDFPGVVGFVPPPSSSKGDPVYYGVLKWIKLPYNWLSNSFNFVFFLFM